MQVQRRTPLTCGNSLIEKRMLETQRRKLAEVIRGVKPVIDTSPPADRPHVNSYRQHQSRQRENLLRSRSEDSKMVEAIFRTMNRAFVLPSVSNGASLNFHSRRKELQKITDANWKLLGRLESAHSEYSCKEMEAAYMRNQRYVFNASFSTRKRCEELIRQQRLFAGEARIPETD